MVRFLESNGYAVSYSTGVDTDRRGAELLEHKVFMSVGHDEYWSGQQRTNVEAARDAGVHMAFFSGNEVFWKTRWENAIDGSGTPYRTLVTYKETHANQVIDPAAPTWTGTWRDPRFSPPGDGGRPENALTGQLFTVNCCAINMVVGAADGDMRFWRNTPVAALTGSQTRQVGTNTVGYEWDEDVDNGFRPAGLFRVSETDASGEVIQDYGSTYGFGTATHSMTMYRASSGALVFGAGTVQWSWGLDSQHDRGSAAADIAAQQATVNLLADMTVQPGSIRPGLVAQSASTDTVAPTSVITSPANGASIPPGSNVTVTGTATDGGGGQVAGVEVSVDGGTSWHRADGRGSWSYTFQSPGTGNVNIRSRAADDSGRIETPSAGVTVTAGGPVTCPCSIWPATAVPAATDSDTSPVEVGVKFRTSQAGWISGIRFYKAAQNTGTHVGSLWTSTGTLLGSVTFSGESASGWQQATFGSPIAVSANTTYVASYFAPVARYSVNSAYFASSATVNGPLTALASGTDGGNGVYRYGSTPANFPTSTFQGENYWVDVVFVTSVAPDTTAPTVTGRTPAVGATGVSVNSTVTATFSEAVSSTVMSVTPQGGSPVAGAVSYDAGTRTATFTPSAALAVSTVYTVNVSGAKDAANNTMAPVSWTFTTAAAAPPSGCPCSIWPATAVPAATDSDTSPVEVGVKFRTSQAGWISGIRFYKAAQNTGTHVGSLWTSTGTLLGSVTFSGESASGWQQATFGSPIAVSANTTYVASYFAPVARYSVNSAYFASSATVNGPLTALASGTDGGNGVYRYGSTPANFPTSTFQGENYWVDVVFVTSVAPDTTAPTVTGRTPAVGATGVSVNSTVTATFSEAVSSTVMSVTPQGGSPVAGAVSYDAGTRTATFTPSAALAVSTVYTVNVSGAKDAANNTMAPVSWTFTTAAAAPPSGCPCSIWPATAVPAATDSDTSPVEVGVKFRTSQAGWISGIRFYKAAQNTGTHVGSLWTSTGTLLGSVTFSGESASGWQQATFGSPIAVSANTTYVASYFAPVARYSVNSAYFASSATVNGPLTALASGTDGGNGVYRYGSTPANFPTSTFQGENYWVDVVFVTSVAPDTTAPTVTGRTPAVGATGVSVNSTVTATFSEAVSSTVMSVTPQGGSPVAGAVSYDAGTRTATFTPSAALAVSTVYTVNVSGAKDAANNTMAPVSWTFTTAAAAPPSGCPCSIWPVTTVPPTPASTDASAVEVGVKFRTSQAGWITGIRFYKGAGNTGTHIGNLWSISGSLLATATFSGESATGWQQVNFSGPVAVSANTTYVASYFAPVGRYAIENNGLDAAVVNGPLTALADGADGGNGVYVYGGGGFPTNTFSATNYFVDVVFATTLVDTSPPTIINRVPTSGATGVSAAAPVSATFSEPVVPSTITFTLTGPGSVAVPGATAYDAGSRTATFTPTQNLAYSTVYQVNVSGAKGRGRQHDGTGVLVVHHGRRPATASHRRSGRADRRGHVGYRPVLGLLRRDHAGRGPQLVRDARRVDDEPGCAGAVPHAWCSVT